jgi:hypothetical protein
LLRDALRRIAVLVAVVVGLTALASLVIGALAGADLRRAEAVGFYVAGAAVLIGSFVIGVRGPLRPEWGEEREGAMSATHGGLPPARGLVSSVFPRSVRRATPEERSESKRSSIGLFAFGIALVLIGAGFDPTRHPF